MFQANPLLEIRLDVSSESSAGQRIHMKNQALFSSKDKSKKICRLLQFLFGAVRVKFYRTMQHKFKLRFVHKIILGLFVSEHAQMRLLYGAPVVL